jgi:hypothetical protein
MQIINAANSFIVQADDHVAFLQTSFPRWARTR